MENKILLELLCRKRKPEPSLLNTGPSKRMTVDKTLDMTNGSFKDICSPGQIFTSVSFIAGGEVVILKKQDGGNFGRAIVVDGGILAIANAMSNDEPVITTAVNMFLPDDSLSTLRGNGIVGQTVTIRGVYVTVSIYNGVVCVTIGTSKYHTASVTLTETKCKFEPPHYPMFPSEFLNHRCIAP